MKHLLNLIILICCLPAQGQQELKVVQLNDESMVQTVHSIFQIQSIEAAGFHVKILSLHNPSGSAFTRETDEVSDFYLVAISEFDELPTQSLFKVGDFFAPKILELTNTEESVNLKIQHLTEDGKELTSIKIGLHKVEIAN